MGISKKPMVDILPDGSRIWEQEYDKFIAKVYVPKNDLNGNVNNYGFRAPLLIVLAEERLSSNEAESFANTTGLADIAAKNDASVIFVYPTCEGGWEKADDSLYVSLIGEIKLSHNYRDGIVEDRNLFTQEFLGFFIRGTKFHTYIYSYGKSADYAATHLLKSVEGEYLWGSGEITPAMVSMEGLSVIPKVIRKDIPILSIGNSEEVNNAFSVCENVLIKDVAEYKKDYFDFVSKFKMWCGQIEREADLDELNMIEEAGSIMVKTSPDNTGIYKGADEHEVGYFAYYNKGIFDNADVPLVIGFHGAGDSSMFLTYVSGWYSVAHKYGFLFVSFENHQEVTASEVIEAVDALKKRYRIDGHRIYAVGFSMGCGKTWDLFEQYPQCFAGIAPASALFPVYTNPFGRPPLGDKLNTTVPLPVFYSGGENSHVSELPFQSAWAVERLRYAMEVNKCKRKFDVTFEDQSNWEDRMMGISGDRVERLYDESRDAYINLHYFDSEDGVCRTVFGAVEGQGHEYRHHTADLAWQFISKFTR